MANPVEIVSHDGVDENFSAKILTWSGEVFEKPDILSLPTQVCITIWKTVEELHAFYQNERKELGVVVGNETDFLATHEAWRGYPRIHLCQERLQGISDAVLRGVIHHEITHAVLHGTPEFYTFLFSKGLQQAAGSSGLDSSLLQQCVYLLSVAMKDFEVVQWLAERGFGSSQLAIVEYLISDTEEDHRIWELVWDSPALRRIALAAFLKTLLPVVALITWGMPESGTLRDKWNEAYGWLSEEEREGLFRLAGSIVNRGEHSFQERLEQAAYRLLLDPW
jgi:hypothetical protein